MKKTKAKDQEAEMFVADLVKINGPLIGGSYSVTFTIGEFQYDNIKELPKLNGKNLIVVVTTEGEVKRQQQKGRVNHEANPLPDSLEEIVNGTS